ncbi:MAG: hypothetical protein ACFB21_12965 [Opitutales bacterium]
MKHYRSSLVAFGLFLVGAAAALAEDGAAGGAPEIPARQSEAAKLSSQAKDSAKKPEETISIDMPDESVGVIIDNVAKVFNLNLVRPHEEALSERVRISMKDVTWQQVFDAVLRYTDYTWTNSDGMVLVLPRTIGNSAPAVQQVVPDYETVLETRLAELVEEHAAMELRYRNLHPKMVEMETRMKAVRTLLEQERNAERMAEAESAAGDEMTE